MRVLFFLGIVVCLVVDTSTKSVRSIYHDTGESQSPLNSVQQVKGHCKSNKDCENSGECTIEEAGNYCSCKDGTEGKMCEVVPGCDGMVCGTDSYCGYSVKLEKALCQCEDENLSFDPVTKKCKNPCKSNMDCENGGECKIEEAGNYCACKDGTDGKKCEVLSGCDGMVCGTDSYCGFSVKLGKALCQCEDENLSFDPVTKQCKKPCNTKDDCKNGAECVIHDAGKYCKCMPGTEGDVCDNVPQCHGMVCGTDAKCGYNVEQQRIVCQCKDEKLSFDPDTKSCKQPCKTKEDCENGAECKLSDAGNYCECKPGTKGLICEEVPECVQKECGIDAICVYHFDLKKAVCQCNNKELSFDPDTKRCKTPCKTNKECENGAECKTNDAGNYCECKPGTGGLICEEVPGCDEMDCGTSATCRYHVHFQKALCQCNDETLSFDPDTKSCKKTCKDDDYCKNGATCVSNGENKFCKCLPGTQGDFCETIGACDMLNCEGGQAECIYDIKEKRSKCSCNIDTLKFDYEIGTCRKTCKDDDSCKNGAPCVNYAGSKFCKCLKRTQGDFCETIDGCDKLNCEGGQAECIYDKKYNTAKCSCNIDTLKFDYEIGTCRKTCNEEDSCKNGANCVSYRGNKFCKCLTGTQGDFCETIDGCDKLNCEGGQAECIYDKKEKTAKCSCNIDTLKFDYEIGICRKPCKTDNDCKNGAKCEMTDAGNYCKCKPGTEGDACEEIPECVAMYCGPDAKCGYDVGLMKAVCQCNDKTLSFDPVTKKCKKPYCTRDEDCVNGAECAINYDGNYCKCKPGTEGDLCEKVPDCQKKDCGNEATCLFDVKLERAVCRCSNTKLSFDTDYKQCKNPCTKTEDCENGGSCENTESGKFCRCKTGTEGDFCEIISECNNMHCGPDAKCLYDDNREAVCQCNDNTLSFDPVDIRCKMCDCGNNSFSCGFIDGKKVCNCHRFHGQKDGQCEICFCGINAKSCRYDSRGNKVCDCPEGSVEINGQCEKIPLTSTLGPIEITTNATRNSSVEHSWDFTTLNRTSVPSSSTVRPTEGDPCNLNPCQNGGTCFLINNKSKCFCRKPYLGILCEADPCDWNPCMNEGVCKIEKEEVKCYCKQPFAGKFCESPIKLDAYVVTLVAASVFSAIVLIFVTCVLCQRCRIVRTN